MTAHKMKKPIMLLLPCSLGEFFAWEDELRKNGRIIGGESLESARNAATLRFQNGKVSVTDGSLRGTKEQLADSGSSRPGI